MRLALQSVVTGIVGIIIFAGLLMVPAGTLNYWQGWLFIIDFTLCTTFIGIYLTLKDPALLERRKRFGPAAEQSTTQRIIISFAIAGFLGLLILCGLDQRFGWSSVPAIVAIVGDVLVAIGLGITLLVLRVNTYSASNIQVEANQTVISTGPYALVRHPMYGGVLVMMIGMPLALGSWWGLLVLALVLPVLVFRIVDEEKVLEHDLSGYPEYEHHVRHRLVPFVW